MQLIDQRHPEQFFQSINSALEEDRISVAYQPKLHIETGRVFEVEALARIIDEDYQVREPKDFSLALQDPLYSLNISNRVLQKSLAEFSQLLSKPYPFLRCAINISELQLADQAFPSNLERTVRAEGLNPAMLNLEIVEDIALSRHFCFIDSQLRKLTGQGMLISLDDFGTGFASLSHLLKMDVSQLKIDRSFVLEINGNARARAIVASMVELCQHLNIEVVAEGVENEQIEATLLSFGCSLAQGFLYARPMQIDELLVYLAGTSVGRV